MLPKTIIADLVAKIEAAAGAKVEREYVDTDVCHPTGFMDYAPEIRSQGREMEKIGKDLFVIRGLQEDGVAFDLWFALHISGESVVAPVIK